MHKTSTYISVLLTVAVFCVGCTAGAGGATTTIGSNRPENVTQAPASANGELRFKIPEGWVTEKPGSNMRVAQFKLPKIEGDADDAGLVLYFFGSGQGGSVSDNVDRWVNQMQQAD